MTSRALRRSSSELRPLARLLSYDLWRDRFGSAPDIVGKPIRANGAQREVIGVMPAKFGFPIREAVWTPLTVDALAKPRGEGSIYPVIARLKPDVSIREAKAQATAIAAQLESEFPVTNKGIGADVMPYASMIMGPELYGLLFTMLGAGIGVLLIACVNVSNLLVARASLRRREVAVRMALGAARYRIVRQHLTEVLVLATAGAGIGIVLSIFGMRWFTQSMSVNPPPFWITFELDYRVMLFVLGLVLLASLFGGALPALHAIRVNAGSALKDDSRSSTSARLGKFSSGLVTAELAVSCGLLIAAGLMIKSVVQLKNVPMPFAVTQRTREMGVRSALGAQGTQLVLLVMRKSVMQLVIGLFLGLGIALLASGALQPVLYHVNPRDAAVFVAVVVTLAVVSLIASFLPARRVTRIDPVLALANE
ncbi:MAG: FtsX-like permease family protein [Acidobacteria bacterium]|nr:FtsX-like permease family protein [Acidobacteriota bacterium]